MRSSQFFEGAINVKDTLDVLWTAAGEAVCSPTALSNWILVFQQMQALCISYVFPGELKTHRSSRILVLFLATVICIQGFLQARYHRARRRAQRIAFLAVGPLREVLVANAPTAFEVQQCIGFLRHCLEDSTAEEEATVYCLFSSSTLYIGKALLRRANGRQGVPSRIMEHLTAILRKGSAAARTTRAILLRKNPVNSVCFLPVKQGRHDWVKASESIAIRVLRPNGNQGQCKPRRPHRRRRPRRRPPPRFRKVAANCLWSPPFCCTQIIEQVRRQVDFTMRRRHPLWTVQSLRDAYRSKQQWIFAKYCKMGPLSVYSKRNGGLLALWACDKAGDLRLSCLIGRRKAETAVLRLARLVQMVQGYIKRTRGFARVDRLLKRFRMPSRAVYSFRASSPQVLQQARQAVRFAAKATAASRGFAMYAWIRVKTKFVEAKARRFSDRRNAIQAAKCISISSLWSQGLFALEHGLRGQAVQQKPGNWSIVDRAADSAEWSEVAKDIQGWFRDKNIGKHASRRCLRKYWCGPSRQHEEPPQEEADYVRRLLAGNEEVLVPDDKDKKRTWAMPFQCLAAILVGLVLLDSARWSVAPMSPQQLSTLIYGASVFAVPAFLRKGMLPRGSFAPYMYPFVKAKCFAENGGRSCSKKNHSCFRKVVSFFNVPWRKAWRLAGRAVQILIISTGAGFSVWRLRNVIPQFRRGFGKLRSSKSPLRCERCQCDKNHTCVLVADAAQMYEQINASLVLRAFDHRAAMLLHTKGCATVTVKKTKVVLGWPGGCEHARSNKYVVFSVARLRRMLEISCKLCYATLGNIVVQTTGLLIGGLLSMVASICLLSHEENLFLQGVSEACAFIPPGWLPEEAVLGLRYVDDLLLFSSALCHQCLASMVAALYSVSFEISSEDVEQTWTDIIFKTDPSTGSVSWQPKNPNRSWL